MRKKVLRLLIPIYLFCVVVFSLCGCNLMFSQPNYPHPNEYYTEREVGDFVVYFFTSDTCEIRGTTEQGNTKRFLVIPKQIEDSSVNAFGTQLLMSITVPKITSTILEKVFIESEEMRFWQSGEQPECTNFKKIICLNECSHISTVAEIQVYYPKLICDNYNQDRPPSIPLIPANVSYYYNYEDAENNGYYWVDDCDYGGRIEYIPDEPKREGYEFGGWYKESECINQWNFQTDTLPEEKTEQKETFENGESVLTEVTVYQETILYAKWIKKS